MPSWEVIITRISTQTMTVNAETEADALNKARAASDQERGPECIDWSFDASEIETSETDE